MLFLWYPKCTTCQRAKTWLDEHGVQYEARDIKLQNPTENELRAWHKQSGLPLKRFFNTSGLLYKSLGLKDKLPDMSEDEQYALLATDGMLVKRPLIIQEAGGACGAACQATAPAVLTGFRPAEWEGLLK